MTQIQATETNETVPEHYLGEALDSSFKNNPTLLWDNLEVLTHYLIASRLGKNFMHNKDIHDRFAHDIRKNFMRSDTVVEVTAGVETAVNYLATQAKEVGLRMSANMILDKVANTDLYTDLSGKLSKALSESLAPLIDDSIPLWEGFANAK